MKLSLACKPLREFFEFAEKNREAAPADLEKEARRLFPEAQIESGPGGSVYVKLKDSLPCLDEITAPWGAPVSAGPPPSPPPLGPNQGRLKFESSEVDPFHWSHRTYALSGRTIVIGHDRSRIKYVRIG